MQHFTAVTSTEYQHVETHDYCIVWFSSSLLISHPQGFSFFSSLICYCEQFLSKCKCRLCKNNLSTALKSHLCFGGILCPYAETKPQWFYLLLKSFSTSAVFYNYLCCIYFLEFWFLFIYFYIYCSFTCWIIEISLCSIVLIVAGKSSVSLL